MATVALLLYLALMAFAIERAKAAFAERDEVQGPSASASGRAEEGTPWLLGNPSQPPRSANAPWKVPAWWLPGALCVHRHESTDWHIINPPYSGGMQFTTYTWQSVGGRGIAAWASPAEQLYRAWLVWRRDGGSWREWPNTSRMCGLH